jgi:Zn-dependent protease with chaperone function
MKFSRSGGMLIATELGGRLVLRKTNDASERRLLNVIDEMSVAAGIPAPQAFILDGEPGLNAFSAGMTIHDSVVTVTRGLLDQLNRDQLQGVIGHEISHIVNGDARLNLRIIGVLYGLYLHFLPGEPADRARSTSGSRTYGRSSPLVSRLSSPFFFSRYFSPVLSSQN